MARKAKNKAEPKPKKAAKAKAAKAKRGRVGSQAGWSDLREAGIELHAAEVLIGDAHGPARTALPHLRAFWAAMFRAAKAAELAPAEANEPSAWLAGRVEGLDPAIRNALRKHVAALASEQGPAERSLRHHVWAARELFRAVEPLVGGEPLRRRRRRLLWTTVGLLILFGPLALYLALTKELSGEGPWHATYFADRKLEQAAETMREDSVDHNWSNDAPSETVPPDKFSVRWDTCLVLDEASTVLFQVNANDAARVYVAGETVVDAWDKDERTGKRGHGHGTVELGAGIHHLRVEYFESLGSASMNLAASFGEDEKPAALPASMLRYPGDKFDEDDPCSAVSDTGE